MRLPPLRRAIFHADAATFRHAAITAMPLIIAIGGCQLRCYYFTRRVTHDYYCHYFSPLAFHCHAANTLLYAHYGCFSLFSRY